MCKIVENYNSWTHSVRHQSQKARCQEKELDARQFSRKASESLIWCLICRYSHHYQEQLWSRPHAREEKETQFWSFMPVWYRTEDTGIQRRLTTKRIYSSFETIYCASTMWEALCRAWTHRVDRASWSSHPPIVRHLPIVRPSICPSNHEPILAGMYSVFTEHLTNICQHCLGARDTKKMRTEKDSRRIRYYLLESHYELIISIKSLQQHRGAGILLPSSYRRVVK